MAHDYHLGALVSAASAAELLGWCYTGATASDHAAKRLRVGLRFLEGIGPSYAGSDRRLATDVVGRVFNLRNFGAHGAAHGKRLVSCALNRSDKSRLGVWREQEGPRLNWC
jgi:hypothetical protein